MKLLKLSFIDPNSTHFGDGQDNHPLGQIALGIGGVGASIKGYSNYYKNKSNINNSRYFFKNHNDMKKSIKEWNKNKIPNDTMNNYMEKYNIKTPEQAVDHFNLNKQNYNIATRGKWIGRLGVLSAGYGAYNLLQHNAYHKEM